MTALSHSAYTHDALRLMFWRAACCGREAARTGDAIVAQGMVDTLRMLGQYGPPGIARRARLAAALIAAEIKGGAE